MDCVCEQLLFIALAGDAVEEKHFGFHVDVRGGIELPILNRANSPRSSGPSAGTISLETPNRCSYPKRN